MADRVPLFPHVSPATAALVTDMCAVHGCTPSDVVEGALLAYLTPVVPSDRDTLSHQRLTRLEETLKAQLGLLTKIVAHLEAQTLPAQGPIASYAQLYEEEDAVSETAPLPVQPGGWRHRFSKRTPS
jgi:hypothetical protein